MSSPINTNTSVGVESETTDITTRRMVFKEKKPMRQTVRTVIVNTPSICRRVETVTTTLEGMLNTTGVGETKVQQVFKSKRVTTDDIKHIHHGHIKVDLVWRHQKVVAEKIRVLKSTSGKNMEKVVAKSTFEKTGNKSEWMKGAVERKPVMVLW